MAERNIKIGIECFIKKDGKYLLLHRSKDKKVLPGVWLGPGGKVEINEGIFECTRREIKEETGLEIKNLKILSTGNAVLEDLNIEYFFFFIGADYASGEVTKEPEDGELKWLTLDEILKLDNLLAELKHVLPIILENNSEVISYKAIYRSGNDMTKLVIEDPN